MKKSIVIIALFLFLLPELKAQEAVTSQPAKQTTVIHYNKQSDMLDITVTPVIYYGNPVKINYETGQPYTIPVIDYGGWENNYINYQNLYEFQQITHDIDYIYD